MRRLVTVCFAFACLLLSATVNGQLVINEIETETPGTEPAEFVELLNNDLTGLDLAGFQLVHARESGSIIWTLDLVGSVPAGGRIVFCEEYMTAGVCSGDLPGPIRNGSAALAVLDSIGATVDSVAWGSVVTGFGEGTPADNDLSGTEENPISLSRCPDGSDSDDNSSDFILTIASIDESNECPVETICDDGLDNDGDGSIDCIDTDCQGTPACTVDPENTTVLCQDGIDNDGDGSIDCDDVDCQDLPVCAPPGPDVKSCGDLDTELSDAQSYLFGSNIEVNPCNFLADALSPGGMEMLDELRPYSEILAYEHLYQCAGAQLLLTGEEISYIDPMGKKTDALLDIDGIRIGLMVSRAEPLTISGASLILEDALGDVLESSANVSAEDAWVKQILLLITPDDASRIALEAAYAGLSPNLTANSIVWIVLTSGEDAFIYSSDSPVCNAEAVPSGEHLSLVGTVLMLIGIGIIIKKKRERESVD